MNKTEELRKLSLKEIKIQLEDALVEMENLRIQHSTRQLDNPLRIRKVRRDIARMRTILNEKSGEAQA
jgi:large subunit ribosomal protein L29